MAASASNPAKRSFFSQLTRPSSWKTSSSATLGVSYPSTTAATSTNAASSSTNASSSSTDRSSLSSSISENPNIYGFAEIRLATNNFLAKPYSSSSKCWRCSLRGADTIVFQRKVARKLLVSEIKKRLAVLCRSNHTSVVKLLGVSVSGEYMYLVYDFITGVNLSDCLRNRANPNFTILSSWISRIQVASDIAHALDYIHHKTGLKLFLFHKYLKTSGIVISESSLTARICHFGTAFLCGEDDEADGWKDQSFEGVRGYMSPEFQKTGVPSQESDVYAFGVVILELISAEEPFRFQYEILKKEFVRSSLIEEANVAVNGGTARLRTWVDRRLGDSFPVDVVERLVRLALECVDVEPSKRPDMSRVAGKVSKMFLASHVWSERIRLPHAEISVSLAPR